MLCGRTPAPRGIDCFNYVLVWLAITLGRLAGAKHPLRKIGIGRRPLRRSRRLRRCPGKTTYWRFEPMTTNGGSSARRGSSDGGTPAGKPKLLRPTRVASTKASRREAREIMASMAGLPGAKPFVGKLIWPNGVKLGLRTNGVTSLSITISKTALRSMAGELEALGIKAPDDVQDFLRGALVAGFENARRANMPQWKRFEKAIQRAAKTHLGMGRDLDDAEGLLRAGRAAR